MTVKLCVLIDSIYVILNTIHFSFLFKMYFISLFMKLTHIQVLHEARIKHLCLQTDTLFFLLMYSNIQNIYKLIPKYGHSIILKV